MNWIEVHIDTRPDRLDDLCARLEAAGVTGGFQAFSGK